jgi:TPR repeat protein
MARQATYFPGSNRWLWLIFPLIPLYLHQAYAGGPVYAEGLSALHRGDVATAFQLWKPLAEHGDADSQFALGSLYYDGIGVAVDRTESSYWFQLAAEQGLPDAQYNLGNAYLRGEGVRQDNSMAIYWWEKAAKQGLSDAQSNLDRAYRERSEADKNKQSTTRISEQIKGNPSDLDIAAKFDKTSWTSVDTDIENKPEPATDMASESAPVPSIQTSLEPAVAQVPTHAELMPVDNSGGWAVNLVSYTYESAAQRILDDYRAQGIDAEIQTVILNGKPMYRVRIIGYPSKTAAQSQIAPLQELLDLDSVWVSRK